MKQENKHKLRLGKAGKPLPVDFLHPQSSSFANGSRGPSGGAQGGSVAGAQILGAGRGGRCREPSVLGITPTHSAALQFGKSRRRGGGRGGEKAPQRPCPCAPSPGSRQSSLPLGPWFFVFFLRVSSGAQTSTVGHSLPVPRLDGCGRWEGAHWALRTPGCGFQCRLSGSISCSGGPKLFRAQELEAR